MPPACTDPAHEVPCAPRAVAVYGDYSGDMMIAGYAGGGVLCVSVPARCLHVRVSELPGIMAALEGLACGRDPEEPG